MNGVHQWLETICNTVSVALFVVDEQLRCLYLNQAAAELSGYALEEIEGRSLHELVHHSRPDGSPYQPEQCPLRRAACDRHQERGEETFVHKDGHFFPVDFVASPFRVQGVLLGTVIEIQDNTERRQAERTMRQRERHYRELTDAIPHLVWTALPNGKIDFYNQRVERYYGVTKCADGTFEWTPMVHEDDRKEMCDRYQQAAERGEVFTFEPRVQMIDGTCRWHLVRAEPSFDQHGRVVKWYGTATDIHDQKLAEAALRRSNAELEQFIYVAAHDLQEPLRTILLSIDIAMMRSDGIDPAWRGHSQRIIDSAQRMQRLIADLLTYSRVVHHEDEPADTRADLEHVLNDVLTLLQERIGESGAVIERSPLPVVQGHAGQLGLVFQNLIGNAIKYHRDDQPPWIRISAERHNRTWVIAVRDHGIGFDPAYADKIFGLFKRLHRDRFSGTGLGLAISRRIVERYGGRIWAESGAEGPERGSTFFFSLLSADSNANG